jgi:hypothetical protein
LNPEGEFWNRVKRALDLSKNISGPAKNDVGNNPKRYETSVYSSCQKYIPIELITVTIYRKPPG